MLIQKFKSFCFLMVLVIAIIVFCGSSVLSSEPKELIVGLATWAQSCPWDVADAQELRDKAEEINAQGKYKIKVIVTDAAGKREKIRSDIEDLLVQNVDILLVSPLDAHDFLGWKDIVVKHKQKTGKPLVYASSSKIPLTEDLSIEKMGVDFGAVTSDFNSGRVIGQHLAAYLFGEKGKYEGKVVELRGAPGFDSDKFRHEGFHSITDQYPGIETIFEQTHNWSRMEAFQLTRVVLQKYPPGSFDAIWAYNDDGGMGVLEAVREEGRVGEFLIYTSDGQSDCVRAIQEGEITACAVFERVAKICLEKAIEIIEGKDVEKIIIPPDILITTGNVNKLLGEGYKPFLVGEDVHWDRAIK